MNGQFTLPFNFEYGIKFSPVSGFIEEKHARMSDLLIRIQRTSISSIMIFRLGGGEGGSGKVLTCKHKFLFLNPLY